MFLGRRIGIRQGMNSFVGLGTVINGNLFCQGNLVVDGNVNGDINADGEIVIGASGVITGNAQAKNITIGGVVEGNVTTTGILRILSSANLKGDINVGGFIANEGGIFTGKCCILQPPQKLLESMYVEKRDKNLLPQNLTVNE